MNGYFSFIISSELTDYHHSNIEHVCFKFSSTDRGAVIHSVRHNKFTLLSRTGQAYLKLWIMRGYFALQ